MPDFDIGSFTLDLNAYIHGAVRILLILAAAYVAKVIATRLVARAVRVRMRRRPEEPAAELAARVDTISDFAQRVVAIGIWAVAGVTVLAELGVNTTAILATLGVASLAVGFAAQNVIRDFIHGFFIISEDWYRVGEVAMLAGAAGVVTEINLRRTVLRDANGTLHNIPNSRIDMAGNLTRDFSRINLDVEVAYGEDLDRVIQVIDEEGERMKADETWGADLLTAPAVTRVNELGGSGIAIKIMADTKPMRQWALMGELRLRLKKRFDQEGIEIPWPHTKVYFGNSLPG